MSDAYALKSRIKDYLSFIFVLLLLVIITSCGKTPQLAGKFYGYSAPSTTTFGSITVHVGPVLYEVQFDYGENESDNTIKVKMQELETVKDKGGDWQPAFEGTRFTDDGYIDEYAKPAYLYGTYKVKDSKKSITISGKINTGANTDPLSFEWVVDKNMVNEDNQVYIIKPSDDLCFELPTSTINKITVCTTPKYFFTKMIEEIEHNHKIKMSDARRQELLSQPY